MRLNPLFLAIALTLLLPGGASAEYYQYTAPDGTVLYTDDASAIPEDQRPNAQIFESINTNIYPPAAVEVAVESAVQNTTDTESTNAPNIENQGKAAELNAMRAQLR